MAVGTSGPSAPLAAYTGFRSPPGRGTGRRGIWAYPEIKAPRGSQHHPQSSDPADPWTWPRLVREGARVSPHSSLSVHRGWTRAVCTIQCHYLTHLGRLGLSSPSTLSPLPFLISSLPLSSSSPPPSVTLHQLPSSWTSLSLCPPPPPCTTSFLPSGFGRLMPYPFGHRVTLPSLSLSSPLLLSPPWPLPLPPTFSLPSLPLTSNRSNSSFYSKKIKG